MSSPENVGRMVASVVAGDDEAGRQLVTVMRPLVAGLARRFEGRVPRTDLEQAGMVGLLRAARSFDPSLGTPFGGYAAPFVVGEMLACVRQLTTAVKMPRSVADNQRAVGGAIEELTVELGRSPTVAELAERAGLDEEAVQEALRLRLAADPVGLDEIDEEQLGRPDAALGSVERRLDLGARLEALDPRLRRVIVLRFGLELSQRDIGARLGISQMHVSRLLRAGLAALSAGDSADEQSDPA